MKLKLFIVFHKYIFDNCYANISQEDLDKYFVFVAVNENIKKEYTPGKYNVINEWKLPKYSPDFQKKGYNENSAIYHVYANELHKDLDFIGFFQYDQRFELGAVEDIIQTLENKKYCGLMISSFNGIAINTWNELPVCEYIIKSYENNNNKIFNKNEKNVYPLLNTWVIPINTYNSMMVWLANSYDDIYKYHAHHGRSFHHGHIGGVYERITAMYIANENIECNIMKITHDHIYKHQSY